MYLTLNVKVFKGVNVKFITLYLKVLSQGLLWPSMMAISIHQERARERRADNGNDSMSLKK